MKIPRFVLAAWAFTTILVGVNGYFLGRNSAFSEHIELLKKAHATDPTYGLRCLAIDKDKTVAVLWREREDHSCHEEDAESFVVMPGHRI